MFCIGDKHSGKMKGAKTLESDIPMIFYVLDVGGGLTTQAADKKVLRIEDIRSVPIQALWKGLAHPDIHWSEFSHFDWGEYDNIVMGGGIISKDSPLSNL